MDYLVLLESICDVKNKCYPQTFLDKFLNTIPLNNNDKQITLQLFSYASCL